MYQGSVTNDMTSTSMADIGPELAVGTVPDVINLVRIDGVVSADSTGGCGRRGCRCDCQRTTSSSQADQVLSITHGSRVLKNPALSLLAL
jgi:hypothetical protein